ncbi:MAG: hypothetical protein PWQ35_526 [Patescibacteria group bacterium]|nr:hypothetical protein [Patescibacteria group bacterium]
MEGLFKFLFGLGIFVYSLVSAGIFLLIIKILLLFKPEIRFMGIIMS